jgi:hypothetical protein
VPSVAQVGFEPPRMKHDTVEAKRIAFVLPTAVLPPSAAVCAGVVVRASCCEVPPASAAGLPAYAV